MTEDSSSNSRSILQINETEYFKQNKIIRFTEKYFDNFLIYSDKEFIFKIKTPLFTDDEIYEIRKYLKNQNQEYINNIEFLKTYYKRFKFPLAIKINNKILEYNKKKSLIYYKKYNKFKLGINEIYKPSKSGILVIINFGKSSETNFYFNEKNYILNMGESLLLYVENIEYKIKSDISDHTKYLLMFIVKYV